VFSRAQRTIPFFPSFFFRIDRHASVRLATRFLFPPHYCVSFSHWFLRRLRASAITSSCDVRGVALSNVGFPFFFFLFKNFFFHSKEWRASPTRRYTIRLRLPPPISLPFPNINLNADHKARLRSCFKVPPLHEFFRILPLLFEAFASSKSAMLPYARRTPSPLFRDFLPFFLVSHSFLSALANKMPGPLSGYLHLCELAECSFLRPIGPFLCAWLTFLSLLQFFSLSVSVFRLLKALLKLKEAPIAGVPSSPSRCWSYTLVPPLVGVRLRLLRPVMRPLH